MSTLDALRDILVSDYQVARGRLTLDAPLSAFGVDSLGFLELMFKIEDRFHVKIPGDTPTGLHTLQDVVGYIDSLIADQPSRAAPVAGTPPSLT